MDSGLELGDSFESCFDLDNLPENITQNNFPAYESGVQWTAVSE